MQEQSYVVPSFYSDAEGGSFSAIVILVVFAVIVNYVSPVPPDALAPHFPTGRTYISGAARDLKPGDEGKRYVPWRQFTILEYREDGIFASVDGKEAKVYETKFFVNNVYHESPLLESGPALLIQRYFLWMSELNRKYEVVLEGVFGPGEASVPQGILIKLTAALTYAFGVFLLALAFWKWDGWNYPRTGFFYAFRFSFASLLSIFFCAVFNTHVHALMIFGVMGFSFLSPLAWILVVILALAVLFPAVLISIDLVNAFRFRQLSCVLGYLLAVCCGFLVFPLLLTSIINLVFLILIVAVGGAAVAGAAGAAATSDGANAQERRLAQRDLDIANSNLRDELDAVDRNLGAGRSADDIADALRAKADEVDRARWRLR